MSPGRPQVSKDSSFKEEEDDFETPTMSFESFLTYDAPTSVKKKKKPSSSLSSTSHSRPSHSAPAHHKSTPPPVPSSSSCKANKSNGNKRPRSGSNSAAVTPQKCKRVRNPLHADQSLYLCCLADTLLFDTLQTRHVSVNFWILFGVQI